MVVATAARRGRSLRRAVLSLALLVPSASVLAGEQSVHCNDLPESERALCWLVLSCSAIDDESRRLECFQAAAEQRAAGAVPAAPVDAEPADAEPAAPADATSTARAVEDAPVRRKDAAEPRAERSAVRRETVQQVVLDVPDRFSAQVTSVRKLLHNRQLIALDGQLLFETDRAGQSHIAVGDRVQVTRASALFGRRYRISGPARGAVNATRLRCERLELGSDTRRKCAVLDRRSGQQAAAPSGG